MGIVTPQSCIQFWKRRRFLSECISVTAFVLGDLCRYIYAEFKMNSLLQDLSHCGHKIFLGDSIMEHIISICLISTNYFILVCLQG